MLVDETRYHSQLEDFRSGQPPSADDELFFDCAGGRSTPNLGTTSANDDSGFMLQMPLTPTRTSAMADYDQ